MEKLHYKMYKSGKSGSLQLLQ
ncbi:KxYKxGKxW signal peptide domain-containing protein [Lentilactobacillus buchneri]